VVVAWFGNGTPLGGDDPRYVLVSCHLNAPNASQDETKKRRTNLTPNTHKLSIVSLLQISTYVYNDQAPLFIALED